MVSLTQTDGQRPRVLYVDDDPSLGALIKRGLTRKGFDVTLAAEGGAALALVRERAGELDVVVLDYQLPGVSGRDVARQLAALPQAPPTVVVSGHRGQVDLEELKAAGIAEYLPKPFSLTALAATLRRVLERQAARTIDR